MKIYNDIQTYYPVDLIRKKMVFDNFIIINFKELHASMTPEDLIKFRTPHRRSFFEFTIGIKEISIPKITVGSDEIRGIDNHLLFTSMGQVFSIDFNNHPLIKQDDGYIIAFKPSFLSKQRGDFEIMNEFRFFNSYTFSHYVLNQTKLQPIIDLAEDIYAEHRIDGKYKKEILSSYLEVILHILNRILSLNPEEVSLTTFDKIAMHFEQNIIKDKTRITTIADYASRLNISPNYLSESIKKSTGKTAKQIVLNHKLIIAKSLLQEGIKDVAEIAEEMGFSEATNFSKFFKKMTGMTPRTFKRM